MARFAPNEKKNNARAKGRTSRGDLVQSSTTAKPESSSNFRARLGGEEPVPEPTPKLEAPTESNAMEEVSQSLRANFDLKTTTGSSNRVTKAPKPHKEHGAVTKLKELLAEYGVEIYSKAANDIMQVYATVDERTERLSLVSSEFASKAEKLYSKIGRPLSSTQCQGGEAARATIDAHLSNLLTGIEQAQKQLEELQKQWEAAFAEECDAWRAFYELQRKDPLPAAEFERELANIKSQIQGITQEYEEQMDGLEAEYKADMQAETLRILQSWD
ncbi:flagellar fliJ protein domain-containing protein [Purpureocillium lilacinum]|uniref:Flagellar fliJ protein domain-containing protein n=1 Tax=Purpureocillium lilacinum TaxID=33203 RepID=A0A179HL52_PURLI|nr:flagellar fliJ protein domain-containing protein [Purpureocillium lilacinum]OAQ83417.1 flagellar fliJ protein domain-containing protein [Purpureocillium lilacinum]OAQ90199.1 flagellar fliJ protein domain-containing protein [Purpureocillium lilacinum]GJN78538.1 hypothetical protein PLIIFM63780_002032 [Purpureocillium lilacinum]